MKRTQLKRKRGSESGWRRDVMALRGERCRVCLTARWVQCAHVWGKGQGGPTVVENGLPLCREHHEAYDQYRLQLKREWLDVDQVAWLAEVGYVVWIGDHTVSGRGCRRFAPVV